MKTKYKKPIIVAEICCNHMGNVELAKSMIRMAKEANVDIVKFQKRDVDTWTKRKPEIFNSPHENENNAFGETYKAHRMFLEFNLKEHKEIKEYCDKINIKYGASVWDIKSAKQIAKLQPYMIKIASPCNSNKELINWLCQNYEGQIHVSLGMTTKEEIEKIVEIFEDNDRAKDLYLYSCTSGYPVKYEDICLLEIENLLNKYGNRVKGIGFSGHHVGTAIDLAAYTLGAEIIERHFTVNKDLKGTDQKVALTKQEFIELIENLKNVRKALEYRKKEILDVEVNNMEKLKW